MPDRSTPPPADDETTDAAAAAGAVHAAEACPVAFCPVSMFLTATGSVRPEVVEHVIGAARELMLAAQAVLGARAEGVGRRSSLEKIEIG